MAYLNLIFGLLLVAGFHLECLLSLDTEGFSHSSWQVIALEGNSSKKDLEANVLVALELENAEELEEKLREISDPLSKKYAQYLSSEEIAEISCPDKTVVNEILQWLATANGQCEVSQSGDLILLTATVADLEKLFSTRLDYHGKINPKVAKEYLDHKHYLKATTNFSVPEAFRDSISFISINTPIVPSTATKKSNAATTFSAHGTDHGLHGTDAAAAAAAAARLLPPAGRAAALGGQEAAALYFQLGCGRNASAAPPSALCAGPPRGYTVEVAVEHYPASLYRLPAAGLACHDPRPDAAPAAPLPPGAAPSLPACDPYDPAADAPPCLCAAIVGPLPKYRSLTFSIYTDSETTDPILVSSSIAPIILSDATTPAAIRQAYGLPARPILLATAAAAEFDQQFYANGDVRAFMARMGEAPSAILGAEVSGDGGNNPAQPGGETELDVEYLAALLPGLELGYYTTANCAPFCGAEEFLQWLFELSAPGRATEMVHSISYGGYESDGDGHPGQHEFLKRVDQEFLKLGLRGATLVFASGDDGVCSGLSLCPDRARPGWPATSPYVLAVGSTSLSDRALPACGAPWRAGAPPFECGFRGEVAAQSNKGNIITPGGGFSDVYPRPWWQHHHVPQYLERADALGRLPPAGFFSAGGRGYPDVAALGSLFYVTVGAQPALESGTSASAPVWAAVLTQLNEGRLRAGRPPLGFVNPLLYHVNVVAPEAFHDITVGNNSCAHGHMGTVQEIPCNPEYFLAEAGWDPLSGLGSPNFPLLQEAVLAVFGDKEAESLPSPPSADVQQQEQKDYITGTEFSKEEEWADHGSDGSSTDTDNHHHPPHGGGGIAPFYELSFWLPMGVALVALGVSLRNSNAYLRRGLVAPAGGYGAV